MGVVRKGVKTRLVFVGASLNQDNYRMIIPFYDARIEFREGDNPAEFTPTGDFYFYNWTSRWYGAILTTDGGDPIKRPEIESRIDRLKSEYESGGVFAPADGGSPQESGTAK
ncbi:MAG: hypothetical protein JXD23_14680 [Spirochaetales bacterium]|nr:hypothetical protein [Spirochaetales bacterium]